MKTVWNLDVIYNGLQDPAYEADMEAFAEACEALDALVQEELLDEEGNLPAAAAERLLLAREKKEEIMMKLGLYLSLRLSVNTEDGEIMAQENRLMKIASKTAAADTAAGKLLGKIADVDAMAEESEIVKAYRFLLKENKNNLSHMLSNDVEAMIAAMDMTGGRAWGGLQSFLTSTVKVDYDGRIITLSEVRNLAYSADPEVRKQAYEAEIACYEKIQDAIAYALNNIKNQVTMLCEKKGYASPLALTLEQSRMSRETLDALMEAIREYLPVFRKYLRKKGEILGHSNGLPWYELFAPIGSSEKQFTLEECRAYLNECFLTFSPDMAAMMEQAFEEEWIDFYPKKGKEGGAFCAPVPSLKQSRVLTNYDGTFGSIDTLAHELGHAFHNVQAQDERILNMDYPMPVAETASTFNEVFLGQYALKSADKAERLALLESDLKEKTQTIVDIYSRYLFETAVFEQSQEKFLMAEDLKKLMLWAQEESYGDGLDPDCKHPYMWVCKSHYYSSGLSFYNFPYAFGNMFACGLYALYREQGEPFIANYKAMLRATCTHTIEECGQMMGIDLTKKDFWCASLAGMAEEIEEFCALA